MDFKALKTFRKKKNLTQKQLSELSGIGCVTISRMESGKLKESSASTLLKLAKSLECHVSDIAILSDDV